MEPYRSLIKSIILPVSDMLLGQTVTKHFNFLMKSQWWSLSELEEYQNEKLGKLIAYSYQNIPYYRDLFNSIKLKPADIRTFKDLYKIPLLTKEIIRKNHHRLISKDLSSSKILKLGSSGSTGEPLQYLNTKDAYSFNIAASLRGWHWMGYNFGDKYIKLSQNDRSSGMKKLQDIMTRNKYLFSQQLTDENFNTIVQEIIRHQPKVLRGYPDPIYFLAKYAQKNGINNIEIPLIATTGNVLLQEMREFIERQFHTKIFDSYSCEGSANFFEAPSHGYYYATMEYAITELIENGKEVEFGAKGRHITTDLHNYAMPFIRYDTQDYLVNESAQIFQTKERKLKSIIKVEGRDSDILVTPSGKYLIVHNFTGFFQSEKLESVKQFQVRQTEIGEMLILLVVSNEFNEKLYEYILEYWKSYIGDDVHVSVEVVKSIELTSSGKRRFLIRNPEIKLNFIF